MDHVSASVSFLKIEEIEFPLFLVNFSDGVRMDYSKVEKTRKAYAELSKNVKLRLIVDLIGVKQVDEDSRKALTDRDMEDRIEVIAILVRDLISRMIENVLVGLNKASVPLKLFSDFDSAKNWIKE